MLRREKFMVCREGQLKEREAREEPAAFTEECLRTGNRRARSFRSDGKSGLCGVCSHQDCWAERASLEEKTHIAKILWVGIKTSLQCYFFLMLFSLTHQLRISLLIVLDLYYPNKV